MAMRYGSPALPDVLKQLKAEGADRIAVLPAYPQYSGTTTGSIYDAVFQHYGTVRNIPELRFVRNYHDHEAYIRALRIACSPLGSARPPEKLVMSFHGVPKRTLMLGDPTTANA
jgi:ferrochelatase